MGIGLIPKKAASRSTMQSKMCGRFFSTNYNAASTIESRGAAANNAMTGWSDRPPRPTHTTWEGTVRGQRWTQAIHGWPGCHA